MGTVTGLTAARMLAIEAASVVGGHVDVNGHLILTKHDTTEIDGGSIIPGMSTVRDYLYPVGSIYLSTVSSNPGTVFGGTWVAFGAGRMPIGVKATDTRFDTSEEIGGTETITDTMLPTHTHTLGGSSGADAAHTHNIGGSSGADAAHTHGVGTLANGGVTANHTHALSQVQTQASLAAGGGSAVDNAGNSVVQGATSGKFNKIMTAVATSGTVSADHAHVIAGATAAGSSHTHTLPTATAVGSSHTHTMPSTTGAKVGTAGDPHLPPFISVYMWKRTA